MGSFDVVSARNLINAYEYDVITIIFFSCCCVLCVAYYDVHAIHNGVSMTPHDVEIWAGLRERTTTNVGKSLVSPTRSIER